MAPHEEHTEHDLPSVVTLTWSDVTQWARHGNLPPPRRVDKTEAQWRDLLTEKQFRITRLKGTERAHSSEMCRLFEPGRYECLCCGTELFDAMSKYQSHTGWPSFTQPVTPGVVAYHPDESHGMHRIEVTCNVCAAHLGHVFPDGPAPGGVRFCINAVSLHKVVTSSSAKGRGA